MATRQIDKDKKELLRLSKLITKYAHRWGDNPPNRLLGWVDQFNEIKQTSKVAFIEFCKELDICLDSDGYDFLA
jgi:hypothetical protein